MNSGAGDRRQRSRDGGEPRLLSESLDTVMRGLRGGERRTVAGVFGQWEAAVGPQVAAHARPAKLENGRLTVEVDEPGWATQLRYLESDLISRIRDVTGSTLEGIDVRVSRGRGPVGW
jgi:YD repeat-containing protein